MPVSVSLVSNSKPSAKSRNCLFITFHEVLKQRQQQYGKNIYLFSDFSFSLFTLLFHVFLGFFNGLNEKYFYI